MNTENRYQETDLGNVSLNPRGEYTPGTEYEYLDLVTFDGGSYICIAELGTTTSIPPESGKNTDFWQCMTIPGDMTPEYVAMHDRVVNLSEQVEADAEEVRVAEQNVSGMKENVTQMQEQTRQSAESAERSKDSAAGYADSADVSRQAAEMSEQNINAQVTGFDAHVDEKTSESNQIIEAARIAANNAILAQQEQSVNEVARVGGTAVSEAQTAARVATEKASAASESEKNAKASEAAAKLSETNATKMAEQVAADKEQVAYDRTAVENAKQEMTGSVAQIEQNTQGITELKGDLADIYDGNIVWNDGGFINNLNVISVDSIRCYSKFILCPSKGKIRFLAETGNTYVSAIAFYDDEKLLLKKFSNLSSGEQTVDIPSNAKYFRLSGLIANKDRYYYKFVDVSLLGNIYEEMSDDMEERVSDLENLIHVKKSNNLLNINHMLESKRADREGNIVVDSSFNLSERIYVDNTIKLRTTTDFNQYLAQFKEDGTLVGYTETFNSSNPITLNEETSYVLLSAWKDRLPFSVYQSEEVLSYDAYGKSSGNVRGIVEIYNSDTEEEVYLKMYKAYKKGNCDVYWETGVYEFSTIFELLKTKYGRSTAYELPIGGNCRYFFNGSTLIANQVSTDSNVIDNASLMGSWRGSGSYELHDGILKATGMVYVTHDEASGSLTPYTRKYHNIRMEYTSNENRSGMCLGGGTGCKGIVEFDGCVFITNSDSSMDGGYHGKVANTDVESVFYATVKNCYFSKRFQTGGLSANETAELIYCGNSHLMSPSGDKWKILEWNNTTRE